MAAALAAGGALADGLVFHQQLEANVLRPQSESILSPAQHMPTTSIRLVSDYYFVDPARTNLGPNLGSWLSGFRASTGVAGLGQPMTLFDYQPDAAQNLPYLGLGYSRFWFHSQLSLNADFGLASQNASAGGHVRSLLGGGQSFDDIARDLHWSPVMAVNVNYSF